MNIYFAGSISGGRTDIDYYVKIISYLNNYGIVLTEHIGDSTLTDVGEKNITDEYIHDRDMHWLLNSDIIVAEVTNPSLGVGYEIGRAIENRKKVICLYREKKGKRLSAMIAGSKELILEKYSNIESAKKIIKNHLKKSSKDIL
ncbi:MAG: nucleoside 2-deoxyribosyltransferase [Candidatus Marinimicrobia bacterium]|nr:nucleoside 2-deoxyribosyltransferase [Candidatus Neomarinimicrobiota bacterium]|tara:strand:- start:3488 stop:3919 length:432 start_codon:yes stop_codon:yes gene_type:complete